MGGGTRVPCLMRWPGHLPAGSSGDQMLMTIDLLPTVAGLIGATLTAACLVITLGTMLPLAFSAIVPIVVETPIHQDIRPAMRKCLKKPTNRGPQTKIRP